MMPDREADGRFAPGNRIWEARSSAGPKPKFKTPEALWDACVEYFEWVDANPLHEVIAYQGKAGESLPKLRAMTIVGLCLFLDIDETSWRNWRASRPDLLPIITRVERVIYSQKFEGAAAGLFVPNIIARDLGLADRQELSGPDGKPIQTEDVTKRDADDFAGRMARLAASATRSGDGEADAGGEGGA